MQLNNSKHPLPFKNQKVILLKKEIFFSNVLLFFSKHNKWAFHIWVSCGLPVECIRSKMKRDQLPCTLHSILKLVLCTSAPPLILKLSLPKTFRRIFDATLNLTIIPTLQCTILSWQVGQKLGFWYKVCQNRFWPLEVYH